MYRVLYEAPAGRPRESVALNRDDAFWFAESLTGPRQVVEWTPAVVATYGDEPD